MMHFTKEKILAVSSAILFGLVVYGFSALAHGPKHNPLRHQAMMELGIPDEYKGIVNPLPANAENLSAGQTLYNENCADCHGADGHGDTEISGDLEPRPANITGLFARPMEGMMGGGPGAHYMHGVMHHHPGMTHREAMGGLNVDAYAFWSISEGGEIIESSMPAFKDVMSDTERWQVLVYVANGFSAEPTSP